MKLWPLCLLTLLLPLAASAAEVTVRHNTELHAALQDIKDGTRLLIAPGEYSGGHHVSNVEGLTIEALDSTQPPIFRGGKTAWQFSRCPGLNLRHLKITGQSNNGINLDDGG